MKTFDIGVMDALARRKAPAQRLDPRAKLFTTLAFILTIVSFDSYSFSALIPFFIYPAVMIGLGDLPVGYLSKKILWASPFAVMLGIFNPFLDHTVVAHLGAVEITGGWVSFLSILVRFALTVGAALILIATTGFNAVCASLAAFGAPRIFVAQILFLHRYLFVLVQEASRMARARWMRSCTNRGPGIKTAASLLGHLILRALDRAQRIHTAMRCRGFAGQIQVAYPMKIRPADVAFMAGWTVFFLFFRIINGSMILGNFVKGLIT